MKSSNNVSDFLNRVLVRVAVERSSKGMSLQVRISQHDSSLTRRLEIPISRFKIKNNVVTDSSTLSINSIHSHNKDNVQEQD